MMRFAIYGPDPIGAPSVQLIVDDDYAPDVMRDLQARAIEGYRELFGAGGITVDDPIPFTPTDPTTEQDTA